MFDDNYFWLIFLAIPPLLTMRSFAEERASGTLEMLMTAPLRDWQVVLSKYVACFILYVLVWLPTLAYLPMLLDLKVIAFRPTTVTVYSGLWMGGLVLVLVGLVLLLPRVGTKLRAVSVGLILVGTVVACLAGKLHYLKDPADKHLIEIQAGIDPSAAMTLYVGMLLAGAMFLALGLLVSSLVRDQLVAALIALALSLLFVVERFWRVDTDAGGAFDRFVYFFSVPLHFQKSFSLGLIDTRHIVLYVSVAVFCLFLTVRSLESRRWR